MRSVSPFLLVVLLLVIVPGVNPGSAVADGPSVSAAGIGAPYLTLANGTEPSIRFDGPTLDGAHALALTEADFRCMV